METHLKGRSTKQEHPSKLSIWPDWDMEDRENSVEINQAEEVFPSNQPWFVTTHDAFPDVGHCKTIAR